MGEKMKEKEKEVVDNLKIIRCEKLRLALKVKYGELTTKIARNQAKINQERQLPWSHPDGWDSFISGHNKLCDWRDWLGKVLKEDK